MDAAVDPVQSGAGGFIPAKKGVMRLLNFLQRRGLQNLREQASLSFVSITSVVFLFIAPSITMMFSEVEVPTKNSVSLVGCRKVFAESSILMLSFDATF